MWQRQAEHTFQTQGDKWGLSNHPAPGQRSEQKAHLLDDLPQGLLNIIMWSWPCHGELMKIQARVVRECKPLPQAGGGRGLWRRPGALSGDVILGRVAGSVARRSRWKALRDVSLNSSQMKPRETVTGSQQTPVSAVSSPRQSGEGPTSRSLPFGVQNGSATFRNSVAVFFLQLGQIRTVLVNLDYHHKTLLCLNNRWGFFSQFRRLEVQGQGAGRSGFW